MHITQLVRRWMHPLPIERRQEVALQLTQASSPRFDYFLMIFLSCSIATFGLVTDSVAVIIGAMLIAPLMSPIIALSLSSVTGDNLLFRRSLLGLSEGIILAVALSSALGWIAHALPFGFLEELPVEVLSRSRPNPLDLGIALAGGTAAAYALAQPHLSATLPGVAIATALMPPLCSVGIGISLGRQEIAFGALLLFLTNFVAITFAGIVVFAILGFQPSGQVNNTSKLPRGFITSAVLVLLVALPLMALSLRLVNQGRQARLIREVVTEEIAFLPDAQVINIQNSMDGETLKLEITVRAARQPVYAELVSLQREMATKLQIPVELELVVIPINRLDPLIPPTLTPTPTPSLTFTPGPSLMPTNTPTPTHTQTALPTETMTPPPTNTPTATATETQTPAVVQVLNTPLPRPQLRQWPGGPVISPYLQYRSSLTLLYGYEIFDGLVWVEVRDPEGRVGWIPLSYLQVITLTPTNTLTPSMSLTP